jgi:hypothetical protein
MCRPGILFSLFQILALSWALFAQQAGTSTIELFPMDQTCACIKPLTSIPGLRAVERVEGRMIFQVFQDRRTGRELFRIGIGSKERTGDLRYWLYGIATRGDFNRGGLEDYSWHGGDDTSKSLYLLLSSEDGYRRIDVLDTFERVWQRMYRSAKPDFAVGSGPLSLGAITLERGMDGLILAGKVTASPVSRIPSHPKLPVRLRVPEAEFVSKPYQQRNQPDHRDRGAPSDEWNPDNAACFSDRGP